MSDSIATHLVLGASGFLGDHLVRFYLARGEKVIGVDLLLSDITHPHYTFCQCDFRNLPIQELSEVTIVHHAASLVPLAAAGGLLESNVEANSELLDQLLELGPKRILYYSSSAVACRKFPSALPMSSEEECFPFEEYGISKLKAEQLFQKRCSGRVPLSILRPRTILGPGRMGLFELLFSWISQSKTVYLPASPEIPFHFIHVNDLILAAQLIIDTQTDGIFHVGTTPSHDLRKELELLIQAKGSSSQLLWLPAGSLGPLKLLAKMPFFPFAPWQYLSFGTPHILDTGPLRALGWNPHYGNFEMLSESYDWFVGQKFEHHHDSLHRRPMDLGKLRWFR